MSPEYTQGVPPEGVEKPGGKHAVSKAKPTTSNR